MCECVYECVCVNMCVNVSVCLSFRMLELSTAERHFITLGTDK